ncbi:MAG: penicillin acylase family protein [Myxococcota bacterium]
MHRPRFAIAALLLVVAGCADDASPRAFIRTDIHGIHHIRGASAEDVFYGSGYAQAQDRLFQMDQLRRRAYGRRAEIVPRRADDDLLMRSVDFVSLGRANVARMEAEHPEDHALLVAWTEGVNRRIDEVLAGDAPLPAGFEGDHRPERWAVEDGYAVAKLILFGNANQFEFDLLASYVERFAPAFLEGGTVFGPLARTYVLPEAERPASGGARERIARPVREAAPLPSDAAERLRRFSQTMAEWRPGASNNWAVAGAHTADGAPIVAGDPHQSLTSPAVFHMQHLQADDGSLNVAGWGFVGTPAIQLGFNESVLWSATTSFPDWMDLVQVQYDGEAVMLHGERIAVETSTGEILVRDGAAVPYERVSVPGVGVLLPDSVFPLPIAERGRRVLLLWVGFTPTVEAASFLALGRAPDRQAFGEAVDTLELGAFNFIYADAGGIAYRSSPRVPDRGAPGTVGEPWLMLDGDAPEGGWSGAFLSGAQLPRSEGPEGLLVSANNDPFGFTEDGSIDGDPWYFGAFYDPGTRAQRVDEVLREQMTRGNVTLEDAQGLQLDTKTPFLEDFTGAIDAALAARGSDPTLAEYATRMDLEAAGTELAAWDGAMDQASREALLLHAFGAFFTRNVIGDELGILYDAIYDAAPIFAMKWAVVALREDSVLLPENVNLAVLETLDAALAWRDGRPDGATWGDVHQLRFRADVDVLSRPTFPMDGANGTVNVAQTRFEADAEALITSGGAVYRMVATFDDAGRPDVRFQFLPGNSGEPDDPHYGDLQDDWRNGVYRRLPFSEAAIEAATERRWSLD